VKAQLRVTGLAFGYGRRVVGCDVSFVLAGGEVLCLLGPNGSGKTTLFRTLLGLLPAIAGTVTVNCETMRDWSWRERALVFGYVPQAQLGLFPFTVREMVLMGRTAHVGLFGGPTRRDRDAAAAALALLGIIHLAAHASSDAGRARDRRYPVHSRPRPGLPHRGSGRAVARRTGDAAGAAR
jgi:iron complex transport system ATP-binding protein